VPLLFNQASLCILSGLIQVTHKILLVDRTTSLEPAKFHANSSIRWVDLGTIWNCQILVLGKQSTQLVNAVH